MIKLTTFPSLSGDGYITDRNVIVNKLFEMYLASNENQSNIMSARSLKYILGLEGLSDYDMKVELEKDMTKLYLHYFDTVDVTITVKLIDATRHYMIKLTATYNENIYKLDPSLNAFYTDINKFESAQIMIEG